MSTSRPAVRRRIRVVAVSPCRRVAVSPRRRVVSEPHDVEAGGVRHGAEVADLYQDHFVPVPGHRHPGLEHHVQPRLPSRLELVAAVPREAEPRLDVADIIRGEQDHDRVSQPHTRGDDVTGVRSGLSCFSRRLARCPRRTARPHPAPDDRSPGVLDPPDQRGGAGRRQARSKYVQLRGFGPRRLGEHHPQIARAPHRAGQRGRHAAAFQLSRAAPRIAWTSKPPANATPRLCQDINPSLRLASIARPG